MRKMKKKDYYLRNVPVPLHRAIKRAADYHGLTIRAFILTTLTIEVAKPLATVPGSGIISPVT
jgi:hypothetical protein